MPVVIGGNLDSASARATATASARNLARLAIALRREALATGRYPPTLPSIDGVPTDDPLTGGPRAYDVRADGSAELRSTTTFGSLLSCSDIRASLQLDEDEELGRAPEDLGRGDLQR